MISEGDINTTGLCFQIYICDLTPAAHYVPVPGGLHLFQAQQVDCQ